MGHLFICKRLVLMQAVIDHYSPLTDQMPYCQHSYHMTKAFDDIELQKLLVQNMIYENHNNMECCSKHDCRSVSTRTSSMDSNDIYYQNEDSKSEDSASDDQFKPKNTRNSQN